MTLPPDVQRLIDRFQQQAAAYRSGSYNETQTRREFIDPLFEALGWDMTNRSGQAEDVREVIDEDTIRVRAIKPFKEPSLFDLLGDASVSPPESSTSAPTMRDGGVKAPDYAFRIGKQRKFFLEAKKPGVNLRDNRDAAFQLRRYGWSASLPLSVLTDFEEFAVYDCRVAPDKNDKADVARIDYFTYDQLPAKWDWLFGTFGREAVINGSFDQYAEEKKSAKGILPVDKAFLRTIESWRELLARDLSWRNQHLTPRDLNVAVQMTLDRIIFLRICEDRGIESYGRLLGLINAPHIYGRLGQLFREADQRYNSGLFYFKAEKGRGNPDDWTLHLDVGDDELRTIIKRLYFPDSPYVFKVIPADILGQVYEQFLGKVIRLATDHRAVVEDKPEVKKAGGVYYTPTYIVDYIVEHTVGKLLDGKTPKQAAKLRILDPACGSGSFLLGAYQYLLDWYRAWYSQNQPEKYKDAVYQSAHGDWWLTLRERKRILTDHIYGVDIDTQAVEVTKLSLLLKVLEGETEETLGSYRRLVQQRALPSLENNIKCGNSLIGPDFYDSQQMSLLDREEQIRINAFDWQSEFREIMQVGGFDAVIGNPPYGYMIPQLEQQYFATVLGVTQLEAFVQDIVRRARSFD